MGWPDCDVTYHCLRDNVGALEEEGRRHLKCAVLPRVKVQPFRQRV